MALKNTYTKAPVTNMLAEVQKALLRVNAVGMSYRFSKTGQIDGLSFSLSIQGNPVNFLVPINVEKVKNVLRKENNRRYDDEDYVYRVAWACIKDWITAQMALIETEMVEPLQVFLPYAHDSNGETLYNKVIKNNNLLLN